jgi:hypothetical protein
MSNELAKMVAQEAEHVFDQVGPDLLSPGENMSALEMFESIIGLAAFESYADDDAKAALELLQEDYDWNEIKKLVVKELPNGVYGR